MNKLICAGIIFIFFIIFAYTFMFGIIEVQTDREAKKHMVWGVYEGGKTLETAFNTYLIPDPKPIDPNRAIGFK